MTIWANRLYPREVAGLSAPSGVSLTWEESAGETVETVPAVTEETHVMFKSENTSVEQNNSAVYHTQTNTQGGNTVYRTQNNTQGGNTVYHTEVRVDVVNNNQIRSGEDMEALAARFAESLRERIFASAEGVYA